MADCDHAAGRCSDLAHRGLGGEADRDWFAARAEERAVNTATVPDEEARAHPLHPIITTALRSGMAPGHPDVVRVWGRTSPPGLNRFGVDDNAWAGTPEDVADHLVRAIVNHLPVVAGRYVIAPLLPSVAYRFEQLTALPILAHDQVEIPASEPVTKPDTTDQVMRCEVCGCTDDRACPGGCWWARPGLCSRCTGLVPA